MAQSLPIQPSDPRAPPLGHGLVLPAHRPSQWWRRGAAASLLICLTAAIVVVSVQKDSTADELAAKWQTTFQHQAHGNPAKMFLTATNAGSAAALDASKVIKLSAAPNSDPQQLANVQVEGDVPAGVTIESSGGPVASAPQPPAAAAPQPAAAQPQVIDSGNDKLQDVVVTQDGAAAPPQGAGVVGGLVGAVSPAVGTEGPPLPSNKVSVVESAAVPGQPVTGSPFVLNGAPLPKSGVSMVESAIGPGLGVAPATALSAEPQPGDSQMIAAASMPGVIQQANVPGMAYVQQPFVQAPQPQPVQYQEQPVAQAVPQPQLLSPQVPAGYMLQPQPYAPGAVVAPSMVVKPDYPIPAGVATLLVGGLCENGKRQSPINIEMNVMDATLPVLSWEVGTGSLSQFRAFEAPGGSGKTLDLVAGKAILARGGTRYMLKSMTFKSPSEHAITGQKFPLEIQFHHVFGEDEDVKNLVVSAFVRHLEGSTPFLTSLAQQLTTLDEDPEKNIELDMEKLALEVLGQTEFTSPTATNAQSYFEYLGSMTTTPCTEGVTWIILKNPLKITMEELELIKESIGAEPRALQSLEGRVVYDSRMVDP